MGGSIAVRSELGRGTTVTLAIPAESADESSG
jgi:signal transduction histidine kinase